MNVEQVARRVVADVNSDAGFLLACRWVSDRYRQLCSRSRFRHLRQVGELHIAAPISAGVVAATLDSDAIVVDQSSATHTLAYNAIAAGPLGDLVGRHIRCKTVWHEIVDAAQINATTIHLRLKSAFTEDTSLTYAYRIVERFTALDPTARWISQTMVCQRRRTPVESTTQKELDMHDPARMLVLGHGPTVWCEIGVSHKGAKLIEFYPFSSHAETIHYVFWPQPPELQPADDVPNGIDEYVLREGALIDAMRYEAARAAREGKNEESAIWTNSYRAQQTQWERIILEAIKADRGVDDLQFILRTMRYRYPGTAITNAREELFSRGIRP